MNLSTEILEKISIAPVVQAKIAEATVFSPREPEPRNPTLQTVNNADPFVLLCCVSD